METAVQKGTLLWNSINSALIVSSLVRNFVPEKSRKSIMLVRTTFQNQVCHFQCINPCVGCKAFHAGCKKSFRLSLCILWGIKINFSILLLPPQSSPARRKPVPYARAVHVNIHFIILIKIKALRDGERWY